MAYTKPQQSKKEESKRLSRQCNLERVEWVEVLLFLISLGRTGITSLIS